MEKNVKKDIVDSINLILDYESKYSILSKPNEKQNLMRSYIESALTELFMIEFEKMHVNFVPTVKNIDTETTFDPLENLISNGLKMDWISKCKNNEISLKFIYDGGKTFFTPGKFDINSKSFPNKEIHIAIAKGDNIENLLRRIYHEIHHLKQFLMLQSGVINKENLRMAREFATISIKSLHEQYEKVSHDLFYIEADADENAYKESEKIFGNEEWRTLEIQKAKKQKELGIFVNAIGDSVESDNYFDNILEHMVQSYETREILEKYPILQKIYSCYSGRKSTEVLISNMKKDIEDADYNKEEIKEMYYEEICRNLEKISDEDYSRLTDRVDKEELKKLLIDIEEYLKTERDNKSKICQQTDNIENVKHNIFWNCGYIQSEGSIVPVNEFISQLDDEILAKKINFQNITYRDLLESKEVTTLLPSKGTVKLKSGKIVTLKDYLENELLLNEISPAMAQVITSPLEYFHYHLHDTTSANQVESNKSREEEILKYYANKIKLIKNFALRLTDRKITPEEAIKSALKTTTTNTSNEVESVKRMHTTKVIEEVTKTDLINTDSNKGETRDD